MALSRYADKKMAKLAKQNKGGTFQLSSAGHELIGVTCASHLHPGRDWAFPYYRDQPFVLGLGGDLTELFGSFLARATKHHSGGRMMPYHFSHKELRIVCQSSVVGSQLLHAVGKAWAIKHLGLDEVVYVSCGDGATSQGDFHEALNFSALHKLSVIFVIQNNGYAISVPIKEQTAGQSIAGVCRGYDGMSVHEVDGTDYENLSFGFKAAVQKGRKGEGPSVVIAKVPRLEAHSGSDDPKKYKTEAMISKERERDPLETCAKWLMEEGGVSPYELEALRDEAKNMVEKAAEAALLMPFPQEGSSRLNVFAPYRPPTPLIPVSQDGEKIVMMDAINHALDEEMEHDPHVVVFGQDVARNKGGVFGITRRLTEKYGTMRCFNTPLAESTIIGLAIGMAMDGVHRPVAEIQFADYLWTGINQLFNEASSIYYRSNGEWEVPIVVRMPYGGYIQGGPYHSQSIEGFLTHCPGLKVVIPSNAEDAKGLLKTAIRDPNPVIFLEHKALYRQQKFSARIEPSKETLIPFGEANLVRRGSDLTLVGWGMMVMMASEVAEKLSYEGISVEVIDLRTLVPLDIATILESVKKTGKLLIVHEAARNAGFGAEIAARVVEEVFEYLDAPLKRVCGYDSPIPYSKILENEVLPQPHEIEQAIRTLAQY
ncbi:MAG: MFS transporter [Chlamydiia bacterium]|nr:MFS transporter [Chlamydiia bacterium]